VVGGNFRVERRVWSGTKIMILQEHANCAMTSYFRHLAKQISPYFCAKFFAKRPQHFVCLPQLSGNQTRRKRLRGANKKRKNVNSNLKKSVSIIPEKIEQASAIWLIF
jgi:hypothetical protein